MGNVSMEARDINYRGGETKMSVEEALKSASGEAAAIAQLQTDVGNLQTTKANLITIAPVFSAETAYDPGDLVYYNGLTYRCVNAHEGEWDADDFAATTIANELGELKSGLTNVTNVTVVNDGNATFGTYNHCKRNNKTVVLNIDATTTDTSASWLYIGGLEDSAPSANTYFIVGDTGDNTNYNGYVSTGGGIYIFGVASGKNIRGSVSWILN